MATTVEEIKTIVERLLPVYQKRVLEFAQEMTQEQQAIQSLPKSALPPGTPGWKLLRFTVSPEDAKAMQKALEDCERIEVPTFHLDSWTCS